MTTPACWCGNTDLPSFSPEYLRCDCGTLVDRLFPREDLTRVADRGEFYSRDYYLKHLPQDYGLPTLAERARSYLHTNCGGCHRQGGPTPSNMDLRYSVALGATNACDVAPTLGNLGIANARLIAPGDAARSVLIARANRRDANGMPPVGSLQVDAAGVTLLTNWVNSLPNCN